MSELKKCPFCGNDPKPIAFYIKGVANHVNHTIVCDCGIKMRNRKHPEGTAEDWNTRPLEDALTADNAKLTATVTELRELLGGVNENLQDAIDLARTGLAPIAMGVNEVQWMNHKIYKLTGGLVELHSRVQSALREE